MAQIAVLPGAARLRSFLDDRTAYLFLVVVAVMLRIGFFGDPALHVDEQFYLLVGDRMLDGAWPYVDIWDRKPVGLFILFAIICGLGGGTGVLAYQIAATAFAAATSVVLYRIARFRAPVGASLFAGAAYLAWLNIFQGWGGQSPVFYNLFVAVAVFATVAQARRTATGEEGAAAIPWRGAAVMLLLGVAIQIKYTVIFEGAALGLVWLWCLWRAGAAASKLFAVAAAWVVAALAPTALAWSVYAAHGQADAFLFANFVSIFEKGAGVGPDSTARLQRIVGLLAPMLLLCSLAGLKVLRLRRELTSPDRAALSAVALWLAASIVGFASVGNFYYHYTLPLLVPLCVVAFWGLPAGPLGAVAAMVIISGTTLAGFRQFEGRERVLGDGHAAFAMADAIRPHLRRGSLFVLDGPPILYLLTDASPPSRYAFPYHLNMALESPSLGVDPAVETRRLLAEKPEVIVTATKPAVEPNEAVWRLVEAEITARYRQVARIPYGERDILVYASSTGRTS